MKAAKRDIWIFKFANISHTGRRGESRTVATKPLSELIRSKVCCIDYVFFYKKTRRYCRYWRGTFKIIRHFKMLSLNIESAGINVLIWRRVSCVQLHHLTCLWHSSQLYCFFFLSLSFSWALCRMWRQANTFTSQPFASYPGARPADAKLSFPPTHDGTLCCPSVKASCPCTSCHDTRGLHYFGYS